MNDFYLPGGSVINLSSSDTGSPFLDTASASVSRIKDVPDNDMEIISRLLYVWQRKYPRNLIRSRYVDAHETFKDFGISIPDRIKARVEPMIGWPAKAVQSLADLCTFEGFALQNDEDSLGVNEITETNGLETVVPQAVTSCYTHSCSFLTVSLLDGKPVIAPRSADWSAAIWDRRRRRIASALTITSDDRDGHINGFDVWLPKRTYECHRSPFGVWTAEKHEHEIDAPAVVAFNYDPQLNRPFGRSRVSRALMSATDTAFRTIVRMEASAEFYSVPKLWFLGADPDAFSSDTWSSLISAINALSRDEDGQLPEMRQVTQSSMQPHSDMLKTVAMLAASEMSVPVDEMGITLDNPSSAEAMAAAERKLTRIADRQNILFGRALKQAVGYAVRMRESNSDSLDEKIAEITPIWAPTREISDAARADSFTKLAGAIDGFASSEVGLARAGLSHDEITRLKADQRRIRAQNTIDQLKATAKTSQPAAEGSSTVDTIENDADQLKSKFDALGVAIRAGVDPDNAAEMLGLDGAVFTGAVPVSLRMPKEDAPELEEK